MLGVPEDLNRTVEEAIGVDWETEGSTSDALAVDAQSRTEFNLFVFVL